MVAAAAVVVGVTVEATVDGGPVGACVCATVKLREGAVGGSCGLAVTLGGPVRKKRTFISKVQLDFSSK